MTEIATIDAVTDRDCRLRWLREELAIGEAQELRGDSIEMTPQRFEEITRRAIEDAGNGKPIKDAVMPWGKGGIHPAS